VLLGGLLVGDANESLSAYRFGKYPAYRNGGFRVVAIAQTQ
jgi:hypothetical protein